MTRKGPAPKIDMALVRRLGMEDWLKTELAKVDRIFKCGLTTSDSAGARRYVIRLRAQGKCVRCHHRHTTGRYYCPLCRVPRTAIQRKSNRKRSNKFKQRIETLMQVVERQQAKIQALHKTIKLLEKRARNRAWSQQRRDLAKRQHLAETVH